MEVQGGSRGHGWHARSRSSCKSSLQDVTAVSGGSRVDSAREQGARRRRLVALERVDRHAAFLRRRRQQRTHDRAKRAVCDRRPVIGDVRGRRQRAQLVEATGKARATMAAQGERFVQGYSRIAKRAQGDGLREAGRRANKIERKLEGIARRPPSVRAPAATVARPRRELLVIAVASASLIRSPWPGRQPAIAAAPGAPRRVMLFRHA
jgi:hypothetical protein